MTPERAGLRLPPAAGLVGGRFRILSQLGAGGMGAVHLAEDTWRGDTRVALKCAPLSESAAGAALRHEREVLGRLRHPGVVAARAFGRCPANDIVFLALDLAPGVPLSEAAAGLALRSRATLLVSACRALDHVHSRGLVHGDVKSANVLAELRGAVGEVTLVDFGLSRQAADVGEPGAGFTGTASHAAPEITTGSAPGPASDLYALGVLAFEVLAGRLPFEDGDPVALLEAHRKRAPQPLRQACPEVPAHVATVVDALLAKDAGLRPASALALAEALRSAFTGLDVESAESLAAWSRLPQFTDAAAQAEVRALVQRLATRRDGPLALEVRGAPGTGRTRLLAEARLAAELRHVAVVAGSSAAAGEPHGALVQVLREALRVGGGPRPELDSHLALLQRLAPGLGGREVQVPARAPGPPSVPPPAEEERLRMGEAAWGVLLAAAARPLLVVVDDADDLDPFDAWVLDYVGRRMALVARSGHAVAIGLLVSRRATGSSPPPALDSDARPVVRLHPLDAAGVLTAVGAALPGLTDAAAVASRIHAAVGGAPALVEAFLRTLVATGALRRTPAGWVADLAHAAFRAPPAGAVDALRLDVSALEAQARELLRAASLVPEALPVAVFVRALGRAAPQAIADADLLVRHGLAEVPAGPGGFALRPASASVRTAALADFPPAELVALATRLLDAAGVRDVASPATLAELAERAGRRGEAAGHWERALEAASADPPTALGLARRLARVTDGARHRAAERRIVRVLLDLERRDEADHALQALESEPQQGAGEAPPAGAGEAPAPAAGEALAVATLQRDVLLARGRMGPGLAAARRVALGLTAGTAARWQAELVAARAASQAGEPGAGAELAALAQRAQGAPATAAVLLAAGAHELRRARPAAAVAALKGALAAVPAAEQSGVAAAARNNLGVASLALGDAASAARHFARAVALRELAGERCAMAGTLVNLGLLELERGRPARAARHLVRALEVKEQVGDPLGVAACLLNLAVADSERHEFARARAGAARVASVLAGVPSVGLSLAHDLLESHVDAQVGLHGTARERAGRAAREAVGQPELAVALRLTEWSAGLALGLPVDQAELSRILADAATRPRARLEAACLLAEAQSGGPPPWRGGGPLVAEAAGSSAPSAPGTAQLALQVCRDGQLGLVAEVRAHLAVAAVAARRADQAGAVAALACARKCVVRRPPGGLAIELDAASGWLAWQRGDLARAEADLTRALAGVKAAAARVVPAERATFLADPRRAAVRALLLAVRRRQLDGEADAGFFAPLPARRPGRRTATGAAGGRRERDEHGEAARLRRVIALTAEVNALVPVERLLQDVLAGAMGFLQASRGFIVLGDPGQGALRFAASRDAAGEPVTEAEFAVSRSVLAEAVRGGLTVLTSDALSDARFDASASVLQLGLRSVLVAPLVARRHVIGALYVDNPQETGAFSAADRDLLELFAGQAAVAVDNARLHETRLEQERMAQELDVASGIQMSLLPRTLPTLPRFRLAATMQPAREVGGDWYDAVELPDGRWRLVVADVAGKGVPAGLFMVMARTLLREIAVRDLPPIAVLGALNDALEAQVEDDRFMTLLLLELDASGRVLACNAGHEPAFIHRAGTGQVERLAEGGLVLGAFQGIEGRLQEEQVQLLPGDLLVVVSDGITECLGASGERFGRERLEQSLVRAAGSGAGGTLERLVRDIEEFRGPAERSDDLTVLVVEALEA